MCDLKEQVADFISKESGSDADVCSHPDADINNELCHQREWNEKLSNNLHLEREEKQRLLQVNKDCANKLRLVEEQKSLIINLRAMRAKGRAMRVMRVTVKMLRIFICNIYKKTPSKNKFIFTRTRNQSNRFKLMKS